MCIWSVITMLSCLIAVILFSATALSVSLYTKKSFVHTLAPVIFCVIFLLYGFYLTNTLHIGRNIVILFMVATIGFVLLRTRPGVSAIKALFTQPSFLLYAAGIAIFFLFSFKQFVSLFDSLRLWGAYPKLLHTFGTLQLGEDSMLYPVMQSYPPGMPLLCYFFSSFSNIFPENSLFFTYSFFGFSLMLPFLAEHPGQSRRTHFLLLTAVLFIPYLVTGMNDDGGLYYTSLFIDLPLGICCGYFFSRAFHGTETFDRVCAALSCGILVLLKDSGAFLAICGIAGSLVCSLIGSSKTDRKKIIVFVLTEIVLLALAYGSWKYAQAVCGVVRKIQPSFSIPSIRTLGLLFLYFIKTPVSGILSVIGAVHISLPAALILIFTVKLLLAKENPICNTRCHIWDVLVQFLCYCGFFAGYCFSFMDQIENQVYPSFVRYHCTLLICALYILAYDCKFQHHGYGKQLLQETADFIKTCSFSKLFHNAVVILRTGAVICLIFSTFLIFLYQPSKRDDFYVKSKEYAAVITENIEPDTKVYLCMPDASLENILIQHRTYFELLDDGIYIPNYLESIDITQTGVNYDCDSFMNHLIENNYDYVFLTGLNESLTQDFSPIFGAQSVTEENLIYQVDAENYRLIRMQ